jgi:hypothetical protein
MLAKLHHILNQLGVFKPLDRACLESLRRIAFNEAQFARLEHPAYLRRTIRVHRTGLH